MVLPVLSETLARDSSPTVRSLQGPGAGFRGLHSGAASRGGEGLLALLPPRCSPGEGRAPGGSVCPWGHPCRSAVAGTEGDTQKALLRPSVPVVTRRQAQVTKRVQNEIVFFCKLSDAAVHPAPPRRSRSCKVPAGPRYWPWTCE